jgi:DNA primase catalytic subunit
LIIEDPHNKRPDVDKTFFARREFSFTLENDAYLRFQYCLDWKELRDKVVKFKPVKIDIGAVYYASVRLRLERLFICCLAKKLELWI